MIPPVLLACAPSGGGGYVGPLDLVPGAILAYSQRAMAAAWVSNVITIRRDSDDATQSFATTTDNAVDAAAISAFIGGGAGFATTWKDQSGSAKDLLQAVGASQPGWEANAVNGKPALFLGSGGGTQTLATADDVTYPNGTLTFFTVTRGPTSFHARNGGGPNVDWNTGPNLAQDQADADGDEAYADYTDPTYSSSAYYVTDGAWGIGVIGMKVNGVSLTADNVFESGTVINAIAAATSLIANDTDARFVEVLVYPVILSLSARHDVRQNIADYYGITLS